MTCMFVLTCVCVMTGLYSHRCLFCEMHVCILTGVCVVTGVFMLRQRSHYNVTGTFVL